MIMKKINECEISKVNIDETRPEKFRREYKFPEEQEIKEKPKEENKIKKLVKKKIIKDDNLVATHFSVKKV